MLSETLLQLPAALVEAIGRSRYWNVLGRCRPDVSASAIEGAFNNKTPPPCTGGAAKTVDNHNRPPNVGEIFFFLFFFLRGVHRNRQGPQRSWLRVSCLY